MKNKGLISIVLFLSAILFSIKIGRTFCLGEIILRLFSIDPWSRGNGEGLNYTSIGSVLLMMTGLVFGIKYRKSKLAKLGIYLNGLLLLLYIICFAITVLLLMKF